MLPSAWGWRSSAYTPPVCRRRGTEGEPMKLNCRRVGSKGWGKEGAGRWLRSGARRQEAQTKSIAVADQAHNLVHVQQILCTSASHL